MKRKIQFKEHKKPLSREEWKFWEDRLGFFIQEFDDNIGAMARSNIENGEGDAHDHFLTGMSQGMWAIHTFIEDRMVQDEKLVEITEKNLMSPLESPGLHRAEAMKNVKKRRRRDNKRYYKRRKYKVDAEVPKVKVYKEPGGKEKGRKTKHLSSHQTISLFKSIDGRKTLGIPELIEMAISRGMMKEPSSEAKKEKVWKAVANRVWRLSSVGILRMNKKGRRAFYRLKR